MFPKNKINIIFRLLCLISFIVVIIMVSSIKTLMISFIAYCFLALCEKSFRNIELVVITIILLGICYLLNNYVVFKIILLIDYCFYFLDTSYYVEEKEIVRINKKDYIRFSKTSKKKKGSNNITALYLTVHLVILFLAIMVG